MTITTTAEVAAYTAAVRAALADLSGDQQAVLDGLDEHIEEVAAEGGNLVEVLGPPERYAAELRASAGLGSFSSRGISVRVYLAPVGTLGRRSAVSTTVPPSSTTVAPTSTVPTTAVPTTTAEAPNATVAPVPTTSAGAATTTVTSTAGATTTTSP